jgi:transcriptional regulator with XRE-family HTH domain
MSDAAELGAFLKARRAALDPGDLGLPPGITQRRVKGLRREELSQLAGISVDYYTRLEQGRAKNVSDAILDALARALRLTADEESYLRNLAAPKRREGARRSGSGPSCSCCWTPSRRRRSSSAATSTSWRGTRSAARWRSPTPTSGSATSPSCSS